MKTVLYSSPFIPEEWVAAHGHRPERIFPSAASDQSLAITGVCPYLRAFVGHVLTHPEAGAVVLATACDQMRRAHDILAAQSEVPVFLMNVPSTWESVNAHRLYLAELERMGRFLADLGGRSPSDKKLARIMLEFDAGRSPWNERMYRPARKKAGVGLALLAGPLLREDLALFQIVEDCGGLIVLDGSESGERTLPAPFDRRQLRDNPRLALAEAYFNAIPDPFRRPNGAFYQWLREALPKRAVRGIIFHHYLWCDKWHAELPRLKEWTGLPVLDLECGDDPAGTRTRTENRIQAFLEML
jgi:benzoyl-CoA reductase/2-hydroxyglutaryl-CoA dehydratase subunit BcrC/BadD/HgdB